MTKHLVEALMTQAEVIQIARGGSAGKAEVRRLLDAARATDDRHFLAICLDCFRNVLEDSTSDVGREVAASLGRLLRDPAYRRIRPRILRTLFYMGRASHVALPQLVATFLERGHSSILVPARCAVVSVAWSMLTVGDASERIKAIEAFAQLGELGLLNLQHFLSTADPDSQTRWHVESAIRSVKTRRSESIL